MPRFLVLNVSSDVLLLEIRGRVLSSAGYIVVNQCSTTDATSVFLSGDFDVVILCYSIPSPDRRNFVDLIHAKSPFTPVVVISSGVEAYDRSADAFVENDPQALLQELGEVLRKSAERVRTLRKQA